MSNFFDRPILNSPYAYPAQHWELAPDGQPTNRLLRTRRSAEFLTPIPKPKKRGKRGKQGAASGEADSAEQAKQTEIALFDTAGISDTSQTYDLSLFVNSVRSQVDRWRQLSRDQWKVTPETARLLDYWRNHDFQGIRPFFCQLEAVETAIWLTEVAPTGTKKERAFIEHLNAVNGEANPELWRVCLKLATGAGKTTVMAMLIAWQTLNAVRSPQSSRFTKGFLIVTPGITIRDRLRVLQPNDTENYYGTRELVPPDVLPELQKAKIVITNYHAFKLRERLTIASGTRKLIEGREGEFSTLETEGQMLQRVMPELLGLKGVIVLNDEAHHCYREKPESDDETALKGDDKSEAKSNNAAARLWISGLEVVKAKLGVRTVYDLSATPFFLRGSGYAEGTLFPWTVSDFSLMDAIECGIVKLPRVPVADNVPGGEMPKFRDLWTYVAKKMPKKGRGKAKTLDPLSLPAELTTAIDALYGHYRQTFDLWQSAGLDIPPVFIIVCNNTSSSKLVYDYISGFYRQDEAGDPAAYHAGRLELFRNYDDRGDRRSRPRTLLIDSEQLESGEALAKDFRAAMTDEIDRFRYEVGQRDGAAMAESISDRDLLREVMNTVGKRGKLGESIRCVVSVSMLTEGWDCNNVTHVLGVRAFGTQLLCEQVIGRALRRQSYDLNDEGLFNAEYADVFGIPFDFTAKPVVATPQPPVKTTQIRAVRPDRDALEIMFPRVEGYGVELPDEQLTAEFHPQDSVLELTPALVGATTTRNEGIIGEGVDLTVQHLGEMRDNTVIFHLTRHLLYRYFRDESGDPKLHLFGQLKAIVRQWVTGYLRKSGGTQTAQLIYQEMAAMACDKIHTAIAVAHGQERMLAHLDRYNPIGSTMHVNFKTAKRTLWQTDPRCCPINFAVTDSDWEAEFCRVAESHPRVVSYVKNHGLGFEVPYRFGTGMRRYRPDFIVRLAIDEARSRVLNLVVEIKGYRGEDAKEKASTMRAFWVPGVNNLGTFGRWAFTEFQAVFEIEAEFDKVIESAILDDVTDEA